MPHAPMRPPRPVSSPAEAGAVLRASGGRMSSARRAIVTALLAADAPLSVDQVAGATDPPLDVPATYRNLDRLEAIGVVRHVHLGHGPGLYELTVPGEREYGLCEPCGRVVVIDAAALPRLREAIAEAVGLEARFTHFPLVGRCEACRQGTDD